MLKRNARIGLLGATLAGAVVFGLWACVPKAVPIGNPDTVAPADHKGTVKVAVQLPSEPIKIQSMLDTLDSIDLSVAGAKWSPAVTANITKASLTDGAAVKTFSDVPAGAATVAAIAKDSAGATLASASADVTILPNQTVDATLALKLISGKIGATISVIFSSPGEHGSLQSAATYVGAEKCMTCHNEIGSKFRETKHFKGVKDSSTGLYRYPPKGRPSCAQCHSTGTYAASYSSAIPYDYVTKGPNDSPNDLVSHISCEACHGPGSKHIVAKNEDRFKTITRVPDFKDTCAQCHTGYSKQYGTDGKPVLDADGTNQKYNPAKFPPTGVPEDVYMAGGAHNALGMGPVASVYNQYGGYTGGEAVTFTNSHKTLLANGCVNCHMGGQGNEKHTFIIAEASSSAIVNSCQKCHGAGFTEDSIKNHQAQTKLAIAQLKNALVSFRENFAKEAALVPRTGTATKSLSPAVFASNLSYAPTLWDDSDDYVKAGAASDSAKPTINWTSKGTWTDSGSHWSAHQKLYNQAYWNYSIANGELSYGIHAPTYTQYLLKTAYNSIVGELKSKSATGSANFSTLSLK